MKVEGVNYEIDWRKFKRGTSIFFPCLDSTRAKEEIYPVLKRLRIKTVAKISIEGGVRGLRLWRV